MRSISQRHPRLVALCFAALVGCAGAGMEDDPPVSDDGYVLLEPKLDSLAPTQIALGDTVKIFGSDFIDKQHGEMALLLDGAYLDSDGLEHPFTGEIQVDVVNESVAEFQFNELFFHPSQDRIGTWRGTAMLVNRMPMPDDLSQDEQAWSAETDASIQVLPSIKVERLRSADADNCALVTSGTNAGHNVEFGFRALGLGEATPSNPWTVRLSFTSPEMHVRWVVPDAFNFWPVDPSFIDDSVSKEAEPGTHRVEFQMTSGDNVVIDPTKTATTVEINPGITIGNKFYDEVILGMMRTGDVEIGGKKTSNFIVEITTADGRTLRRLATFDVYSEIEIGMWDGSEKLVERYQPHSTSGCVPGGLIGGELSYSEGESLSRSRSVGVRWDVSQGQSVGAQLGPFWLQANASMNWSSSFGVDVNESVSSETHKSQNLSIHLLPSFFGQSFRQVERLERTIDVKYHNECGVGGVVGQAVLTNWNFGFDIAQGEECPPPTNLPPAEVF
jgi:hypothetical protein